MTKSVVKSLIEVEIFFSLIKLSRKYIFCRRYLQLQKIFLPLHRKSPGAIAQLVEQRTENPCVPGSIPGGTTCAKRCISSKYSAFLLVFETAAAEKFAQE